MPNYAPWILLHLFLFPFVAAQMPGFISLDCGGVNSYTDDTGLQWSPDDKFLFGQRANISAPASTNRQYATVRYFPADSRKYCYTLNVRTRTRYLVRATFLYGNFDNSNVYPKFDLSLGPTPWSTIVVSDAYTPEIVELVLLASQPTLSVCVSNASTGMPFISTLELRQFNGSVYYTQSETRFLLSLAARINFGAESNDSIRYPDDPFDRIWQSDSIKRANYLVDVAPGTEKISTTSPIYVGFDEMPPQKVMKTAVVGQNGTLTYRLDLEGFPANAWAFSYLAEIEDLPPDETRKFKLFIPGRPEVSKPTIDVQENAGGKNRMYEPGFWNISLPFVFSFGLRRTNDSSRGPILNALEIYKYLEINLGSLDATTMASFASNYPQAVWAQEGGDPCLPASWTWVQCSADPQPRVVSIMLSGKGITGNIPSELTKLPSLVELHLDGNSFSGPIPDFSGSPNLEIIHLENNDLSGGLPSSFGDLAHLKELYIQNNKLSGVIPSGLLKKNIAFNYTANTDLQTESKGKNTAVIILFTIIGVALLLVIGIACCLFQQRRKETKSSIETNCNAVVVPPPPPPARKLGTYFSEVATESAHRFALSEIENATDKFEKKIGSGGFGIVYYGKLTDGREIAVKVLTNESYQGIREFLNEVTLLSRIHHRNLVTFYGYSQQDGKNILVYEFMQNGTLKEHLRGSSQDKIVSWVKRLEIAEDAAKGIEYLHSGCSPTIIHRDLKSSNILLDKNMRAKVSDFGLSKPAADGSHVSSIVRGTVGYLDPEYYISQQLTEKSDIYSFGVILLELISGHEPISNENFGINCRNIVAWARANIESGNIHAIIDPALEETYDIQSIWKIAETAILCVKPKGMQRPSITEVLKEIQEAILIEKRVHPDREYPLDIISKKSMCSSGNLDATDLVQSEHNDSFDDLLLRPGLR
ncbi:Leucine-rich repeat protein kinase family protein [Rhynchospora pubera]|uniref:Leucine-rich repeat protein kinase family protein n=1 Tax=Rhynchospora pubera TaxID=906938 RepID=A0AAV8GQL1_9POAL|nr:Leucine-rich repeat protein kinase family protein [Rhynchospora pubera]